MSTESAARPVARQISMNAVMRVILSHGPTSRAELARLTGLSKQTVSEVVRTLESAGWLRERGRLEGRLGRRAVTYEIDGRAALIGAIDLGGSKLHVAIGDLVGNVVAETLEPTDLRGGARVVERIAGIVAELAAAAPGELRLAVLGTPGVFHPENGRIDVAPNIPGLDRIDVRGFLAERLRVPVLVENDVNLAASGELWRGHGAGLGHFVFIALGTGVGMGIVAEGRLLRGARGAAGEISYLPLGRDAYDPSGFASGTFESAVGSAAITQRFAGYGGRSGATVRDVFAAFEAGDPAAVATVEETGRLLAPAIASVGAILDPELVVLGGSIGARPELLAAIRRFLPRCTPFPPRVETSRLGTRATLIGALELGAERIRDQLFGVDALTPSPSPVGLRPALAAEPRG